MSQKCNKNSKFWISQDDFQKVIDYAAISYDKFKAEIAGQLVVIEDKDGDFILKCPEIMKQTVSGGECTLDEEAMAKYYTRAAMKHGADVRFCWWHSHHTMGAFWSGTDNATILSMPSKDWSLSLVVNLKKEYKLRVQFFEPFLHEENVELNFLQEADKDFSKEMVKEVEKLCTANTTTVYNYKKGSQTGLALGGVNTRRYDYLDAFDYGGYGHPTREYNTDTGTITDWEGIPDVQKNAIEDQISDKIDSLIKVKSGKKALQMWNSFAKKTNKDFIANNVNLKITTYKSAKQFEDTMLQYWPIDYVENRKEVQTI